MIFFPLAEEKIVSSMISFEQIMSDAQNCRNWEEEEEEYEIFRCGSCVISWRLEADYQELDWVQNEDH